MINNLNKIHYLELLVTIAHFFLLALQVRMKISFQNLKLSAFACIFTNFFFLHGLLLKTDDGFPKVGVSIK